MNKPTRTALWGEALTRRDLWRRSLTIGAVVGLIQVTINQGDVWLRQAVDATVIVKTLVTPLVAVSVAVVSAAGAYVDREQQTLCESDSADLM